MSNEGVTFAGDGAEQVSTKATSTNQPNSGKGGGKEIEFTGNGGNDVTHGLSGTNPPSGSKPGGKGEIQWAGNGDMQD